MDRLKAARSTTRCYPPRCRRPVSFARLRARRGPKKAIIAIAAAILTAVYWMLRRGTSDQDLGTDYFERTDRQRLAAKLPRKLDQLGFTVALAERLTF